MLYMFLAVLFLLNKVGGSIVAELMANGTIVSTTHIGDGFDFNASVLIMRNDREKEEDTCTVTPVRPIKSEPPYNMCLEDWGMISQSFRVRGRWPDCDALKPMWAEAASYGNGIFLDIGANIGSCSLFMAHNGADVISFEPIPANYKKVIQSIHANPDFGKRMKLYPYGLGAADAVVEAFGEPGNLGNTVLGKPVLDYDRASTTEWMKANPYKNILVRRLDDMIWANRAQNNAPPPLINLLKIDCQGFEMKVIEGAKELFRARAIKTVKFELSRKFLEAQGTSASELCHKWDELGFRLSEVHKRSGTVSVEECVAFSEQHAVVDLIGRLKH